MIRISLCAAIAALSLIGCESQHASDNRGPSTTTHMSTESIRVVFLTRDGCANTPVLLANLRAAAESSDQPVDLDIVNQGSLPATDVRLGYATPTILYNNRDLFGSPTPEPPFPAPS